MLQCFNLLRDFAKALSQVSLGAVLDFFVTKAIARLMKLKLCFKLGALGI